ncbi:MAG: tetratricopeptide repeat protein [Bryobacteraceae bacterium]
MTKNPSSGSGPTSTPEVAEPQCLAPGDIAPKAVKAQLEKILASELFKRSPQLSRFLTYVVTDTLEQKGEGLKEYEIGRQVFQKPESFDVRLDPIVRVEARRLRGRLTEYYAGEGEHDPVLIDLGKRGYRPAFCARVEGATPESPKAQPPPGVEQGTAIAVLPFIDMTEDGDQGYFCDGLTEELIHALTRVPDLQVASRSSAFQFKGGGQDVRKVGADLGVTAVMEGSLRKQGKKMRVTAQLTSASTGFHLWSEIYDTELEDLFEVQERIATAIVETVRKQNRSPVAGLLRRRQTEHPEAYRAFLQGLQLQRSTLTGELLESELRLQTAVEADPSYGPAFAALARTRIKLLWQEIRAPHQGWPLVKAAVERALELDPASAIAQAALGSTRAACDWNWPEAAKCFDAARAAAIGDAIVRHSEAVHLLAPQGRLDEALDAVSLAVELSSNSIDAWTDLGWVRFFRREYSEAADQFRAVLSDKPDHVHALLGLARTYVQTGEPEKAVATARLATQVDEKPAVLAVLAMSLAAAGRRPETEQLLERLFDASKTEYVSPVSLAMVELTLGRHEKAFSRLADAVEARAVRLIELDIDPVYDPLRPGGELEPFRIAVCLAPPPHAIR